MIFDFIRYHNNNAHYSTYILNNLYYFDILNNTVFNSKLSNLSLERKRDRKDDKGAWIGYKNGLFLNRELANKNKWHIEDISDRTDLLVKLALDKFKVNGE